MQLSVQETKRGRRGVCCRGDGVLSMLSQTPREALRQLPGEKNVTLPHLGVGARRQRLFALLAAEAGPVPVLPQ